MSECVHLTSYGPYMVCGNPDSKYLQGECGKCNLRLSIEDSCPHMSGCGHSGEGQNGCHKDKYCSYRRIRFQDGPNMPPEMKQKLVEYLLERRK